MTENQAPKWYQKPKTKNENSRLLRFFKYLWAAVCSGTGSGLIVVVGIYLLDIIGRQFFNTHINDPVLDFKMEVLNFLLVFFMGGAIGLLFGTPIWLSYGTFCLWFTRNLVGIKHKISLGSCGFIGGVFSNYFGNQIINGGVTIILRPDELAITALSGIFAIFIYYHLAPKLEKKDEHTHS